MTKRVFDIIIVILGMTSLPLMSFADSGEVKGAFSVKAGTLGYGLEYSYPVDDKLSVAVGVNRFGRDFNKTVEGVSYRADLDLRSASLLAHVRPWESGFRLSGGVVLNG